MSAKTETSSDVVAINEAAIALYNHEWGLELETFEMVPLRTVTKYRERAAAVVDAYLASSRDRALAAAAWDESYEAAATFHEGRKGHWANDVPRKGLRTFIPEPAPANPYAEVK